LKEIELTNGWSVLTTGMGNYAAAYRRRALVTAIGPANPPQDAIYPVAEMDATASRLLRHALPGGTAAAGGRLLVVDDV
jgi:hypothetical protein